MAFPLQPFAFKTNKSKEQSKNKPIKLMLCCQEKGRVCSTLCGDTKMWDDTCSSEIVMMN